MKKRWKLIFLVSALSLILWSCGNKKQQKPVDSEEKQTESVDGEEQLGDHAEADRFPGLKSGFSEENLEKEDGLTLLASLDSRAMTKSGKGFSFENFYCFSGTQALIRYALFDQTEDRFTEEDFRCDEYLASYDFATKEIGAPVDISADRDSYNVVEQKGLLWRWNIGSGSAVATGYQEGPEKICEFTAPPDAGQTLSPDGQCFYYISGRKLYCADTAQGMNSAREVLFQRAFSPTYLSGVFQNGQGQDCGLLIGVAGDLKTYLAAANLETGEIFYAKSEDGNIPYMEETLLAYDKSWLEDEIRGDLTVYAGGGIYRYVFPGEGAPYVKDVGDGRILFARLCGNPEEHDGSSMELWLYDGLTGTKLGSARLDTDLNFPYVLQAKPYPENDALLLYVSEESGEALSADGEFYRWDYTKSNQADNDPTVTEIPPERGQLDQIADQWDPADFTPEACSADLADLRARADALEAHFGIELKIAQECKDMVGGYAVTAVTDRQTIENALSVVDYELSKYPSGFFGQFAWEGIRGITVSLSGVLIGIEGDVLDTGGGVTVADGDRFVMAVDCTDPSGLAGVLHHEIAHMIDRKLQSDYSRILLDENAWEALNPRPDMYGYDYRDYMNRDYEQEGLYDYIYQTGTNMEEICFTDLYALTFPTEDRARIFEYAMSDGNEQIWEQCPKLKEKLRFYAGCIRRGFDTAGWENVLWERPL